MTIKEDIGTFLSWKDFAPNVMEVTTFSSVQQDESNQDPNSNKIKFYCKSFTMSSPSLDLERHPYTRNFLVKSYKPADDLTIDWREDANLSVWRFHEQWMEKFYNKNTDSYVTTANGKKKNATIVFYSLNSNSTQTIKHTFNFYGLILTSLPSFEGGWEKDSSSVVRQITYKMDYWNYSSSETSLWAYDS